MKQILIGMFVLLIAVVLTAAGCQESQSVVGGDKDEHGCIGSAGYSWCEAKQKCLRTWEEPCEELVGGSCGTVSPNSRDECCALKMKDVPHVMCVGKWIYNSDKSECEFICESSEETSTQIANPASVKCIEDGGELQIVDSPEGQYGMCYFPDGTVCEEWAYFRGECNKKE